MYRNRCNAPASVNGARDAWIKHKWCRKSCFLHGSGYEGDNCKVSVTERIASQDVQVSMVGVTMVSIMVLLCMACAFWQTREAPDSPTQSCLARWFGTMGSSEEDLTTVKCYYHKVSINTEGEEEVDTTVVRVPLNMEDSQELQDVLAKEGLNAGEDWTSDAGQFKCTYEDSEHDQVTITASSKLGDVRQHAQKLHVFQTVAKPKGAVEEFEVEQDSQEAGPQGEFSAF